MILYRAASPGASFLFAWEPGAARRAGCQRTCTDSTPPRKKNKEKTTTIDWSSPPPYRYPIVIPCACSARGAQHNMLISIACVSGCSARGAQKKIRCVTLLRQECSIQVHYNAGNGSPRKKQVYFGGTLAGSFLGWSFGMEHRLSAFPCSLLARGKCSPIFSGWCLTMI